MGTENLPPITDQEIHYFVWGSPATQRRFETVRALSRAAAPLGLIQMGALIAYSYVETRRPDLLVGGSLLALTGGALADLSFGKHYLSRAFSRAASFVTRKKIAVTPAFVLASAGIGACLTLAGGEIFDYAAKTDAPGWDNFLASASALKIAANAAPFLAASAMDIPRLRRGLKRFLFQPTITLVQNGLGVAGALLIAQFARKAGLPVFEGAALVQMAGSSAAILANMYVSFSPHFFMPHAVSATQEARFLLRVAAAGKEAVLLRERRAMLEARGHMTPALRLQMKL